MDIVLGLIAGGLLCCCVLLTFGCVCHLFRRRGFSSFEDEVESGHGVSMYPTNESAADMSPTSVTFEPLPDILAKTVGSRALRPRITCFDKQRQATAAKLVTVYQPFPRSQLLYVKEIGLGWFGQVLQGEADRISPDGHRTKVIVKILKDDASPADKKLFLEEVNPYREIEHSNILKLLGQCTETLPFLAIMEFPLLGDLKSYLLSQGPGPYIKLAIDAATGLACLHKNGFVHHDFAARNCLLMSDMTLKIGDYGIGEDLFREDYYDTGCDLLPIRWMSPESLCVKNSVWQLSNFSSQSNVWSLSVMLWEILAHGRKPYSNMKDEDVLQRVISTGHIKLPPPSSDIPLHDRWYEVMEMCWQEADDRPTAEDILAFLQQIDEESSTQRKSPKHSVQRQKSSDSDKMIVPNGPTSPTHGFSTTILSPKIGKHSTRHVAEVLVHRVDDPDFVSRNHNDELGFEDDFSKINIRKNKPGEGFEDDFVQSDSKNSFSNDLSQNDSILAYGGNASETNDSDETDRVKHIISTDPNMNLLTEPVPVVMSTPSKQSGSDQLNLPDTRTNQSESFNTALSNQVMQGSSSQYQTAMEPNSNNSGASRSVEESEINSKHLSENQNDEGYRTDTNRTPDIIVSTNQTDLYDSEIHEEQNSDENRLSVNDYSGRTSDLETERAKEIYMSKGAALPPSSLHKSRSLGTIPEDGIPSDNTSQSGVVFDEPASEEIGQGFEWDDYIGEELVGRVRYTSDESPRPNEEFTEWTFDQESGSEASNSKPGSIASDSDGEVTRHTTTTTIDTRAYIANLLTNRLNSLARQTTNPSPYSDNSTFYSFSQYDDPFEHASNDSESPPFSPMSPIAENPNDLEILEHEIDLENASVNPIVNDLKQNHDNHELQTESSLSMLTSVQNSDGLEIQTFAAHDLEPRHDSSGAQSTAEDKSEESLQLEEGFVWVDNEGRQGQDEELMKNASNKSSTSSDPSSLDTPDVVIVESCDKMLKDTHKAVA